MRPRAFQGLIREILRGSALYLLACLIIFSSLKVFSIRYTDDSGISVMVIISNGSTSSLSRSAKNIFVEVFVENILRRSLDRFSSPISSRVFIMPFRRDSGIMFCYSSLLF